MIEMNVDVGIMHIVVALLTIYIPFYLRAADQGYHKKVVLGSVYIAQSIVALVSTSFIGLYINLELMMLWAVALIMGKGQGLHLSLIHI